MILDSDIKSLKTETFGHHRTVLAVSRISDAICKLVYTKRIPLNQITWNLSVYKIEAANHNSSSTTHQEMVCIVKDTNGTPQWSNQMKIAFPKNATTNRKYVFRTVSASVPGPCDATSSMARPSPIIHYCYYYNSIIRHSAVHIRQWYTTFG